MAAGLSNHSILSHRAYVPIDQYSKVSQQGLIQAVNTTHDTQGNGYRQLLSDIVGSRPYCL